MGALAGLDPPEPTDVDAGALGQLLDGHAGGCTQALQLLARVGGLGDLAHVRTRGVGGLGDPGHPALRRGRSPPLGARLVVR